MRCSITHTTRTWSMRSRFVLLLPVPMADEEGGVRLGWTTPARAWCCLLAAWVAMGWATLRRERVRVSVSSRGLLSGGGWVAGGAA